MTIPNTLWDEKYNEKWALIPSDPAVFDDMIKEYNVKDTKVQEVLTLDFEDLTKDGLVHGLIFISRYIEEELPPNFDKPDPDADKVIFTSQVVTNVCGTLALLAVLFNADIERGDILNNFLQFTEGFSPVNRGLCLGSSTEIRKIHDAYATNSNDYIVEEHLSDGDNDNMEYINVDDFHYITYIHKNGYLWELDGLKYQPVKITECNENNWLDAVKPILEKRMNSSAENELTFSLMAVTQDTSSNISLIHNTYKTCLADAKRIIKRNTPYADCSILRLKNKCVHSIPDKNTPHYNTMIDIWSNIRTSKFEEAKSQMDILQNYVNELEDKIRSINELKQASQVDVVRQKFDYFPVINAIFTKSYKHKLLDDQPPPSKTKKKTKTVKEPAATPKRPAKRRKPAGSI